ncbi:MAG: hypothetical protein M1827_007337 [Pycnora praestabilis]|nr:MAG: hypothetical protein M1827_007337 [Pycnora praestabilis]
MSSSLSGCVASLKNSMQLLDSSISILDSGVSDFPRLAKVLQTTRHFELLPEYTLQTAQSSLLASITPEVTQLLSRASTHLDKLSRREQSLIARCELQEGRLGQQGGQRTSAHARQRSKSSIARASQGGKETKLRALRQKKERLSYAVERLTLQAQQKERQLRLSVAAQ